MSLAMTIACGAFFPLSLMAAALLMPDRGRS